MFTPFCSPYIKIVKPKQNSKRGVYGLKNGQSFR